MKRQPKEQKEIFSEHISNKGLVSRKYKVLLHLNNKKTNNSILHQGRMIWINLSKKRKDTHIKNKYIKRCSTSLVIREMQMKATMTYCSIPTVIVITKSWTIIHVGEGVENLEALYIAERNVKWAVTGKSLWQVLT